jgi:DMSO/TMAO reductase YedYZ heme-binding membrane subunit
MTLNGELNIIFGILSFLIMILVALSSINSIANSFNWSEWQFVQSKLGISCLTVGLIHGIFMYARIYLEKDEFSYTTTYLLTRVKLIALYLPTLVLVLRFLFAYFTPLSNRIQMIRDGTLVRNTFKKTQ